MKFLGVLKVERSPPNLQGRMWRREKGDWSCPDWSGKTRGQIGRVLDVVSLGSPVGPHGETLMRQEDRSLEFRVSSHEDRRVGAMGTR